MKIKYRLPNLLIALLLIMTVALMPIYAGASSTETTFSLTVNFTSPAAPLVGSDFKIYRVFDEHDNITEAFSEYPVDTGDFDTETLSALASTLAAYVARDSVSPDYEAITDSNGQAAFANIERGVYLVVGTAVTYDTIIYTPQPYLISVPNFDPDGAPVNDVQSNVKYDQEKGETTERSVKKIWEDNDYPDRPAEVVVQLLRDGNVYDEVVLNSANNWTHTWTDLDPQSTWQLTEEAVPENYTVEITQEGTEFIVVNTNKDYIHNSVPDSEPDSNSEPDSKIPNTPTPADSQTPVDHLPQTGQLWWPVPVLLIAGVLVILIGVVSSNSTDNEKD